MTAYCCLKNDGPLLAAVRNTKIGISYLTEFIGLSFPIHDGPLISIDCAKIAPNSAKCLMSKVSFFLDKRCSCSVTELDPTFFLLSQTNPFHVTSYLRVIAISSG